MPIAGRLYDRLQAKFGKQNVFMDFDSIPAGIDFRERIRHTIERSNLVIAVIGPHWLGEQSDGSRRIDDPTDFVRLEIDYALKAGIPIIPLLVNSTPMPKSERLPSDIQALAFRNALPLDSGLDFHQHTDRLINGITNIASIVESRTADQYPKAQSHREFRRNQRNKILKSVGAIVILLAVAGAFAWFIVPIWMTERNLVRSRPNHSAARVAETVVPPSSSPEFATATHATPMIAFTPFPSPSIPPPEANRDVATSTSASQPAAEGTPGKHAPQATSTIPRFFVGTWEGEVNQRGQLGPSSYIVRFVIDEGGRGGFGSKPLHDRTIIKTPYNSLSHFTWVQKGPRTLSCGEGMTLRVSNDGKSAVYELNVANEFHHGTLYKIK